MANIYWWRRPHTYLAGKQIGDSYCNQSISHIVQVILDSVWKRTKRLLPYTTLIPIYSRCCFHTLVVCFFVLLYIFTQMHWRGQNIFYKMNIKDSVFKGISTFQCPSPSVHGGTPFFVQGRNVQGTSLAEQSVCLYGLFPLKPSMKSSVRLGQSHADACVLNVQTGGMQADWP